ITTWLSQLNAFAVLIVSFLFSVMKVGGGLVEIMGIPSAASDLIQGIILLCVLGCEFFLNYKIVFTRKHDLEVSK
ncbi:MAG: ABC transporter permease, partial [Clostridiales bacterium]|nr:ABC transporter permease [Clostridiales bacterium]